MKSNKDLVLSVLADIGRTKMLALREGAVEKTISDTDLIDDEDFIPDWKPIDFSNYEIGTPVRDPMDPTGQVYKLWQKHDATGNDGWRPELAVSLWDVAHTKNPDAAKAYREPQGTRGLYQKNEVMIWTDGKVWRSKIDNNSWTPDGYPQGWEIV